MAVRWIGSPGGGDGTTWDSAASIADLDTMCAEAGAGGEVRFRADDTFTINGTSDAATPTTGSWPVTNGGTNGNVLTLRGSNADGTDGWAYFRSDRSSPYVAPRDGGRQGAALLYVTASHVHVHHLHALNASYLIALDGTITDVELDHLRGANVRRLILGYTTAALTSGHFHDLVALGFSKAAVQLQGPTSTLMIEDFAFDSQNQDRDNFCIGISFLGTSAPVGSTGITIRRGTIRRLLDTYNSYHNADGIGAETYDSDFTIEDVLIDTAADGGVDMKAANITLTRVRVRNASKAVRLWNHTATVTDCVVTDPHTTGGSGGMAMVAVAGGAQVEWLGGLIVAHDAAADVALSSGDGDVLTIRQATINAPEATLSSIATTGTITFPATRIAA